MNGMEQHNSGCRDLPHRVAAGHHAAVNAGSRDLTSSHVPQPRLQLQRFRAAPNTYSNVTVAGEAKAKLGDIYIYNVGTSKEKYPSIEAAPGWQCLDLATKTLITATATSRTKQSSLTWLLQ